MAIDIAEELELPLFLTDFSVFERRTNPRSDSSPWFIDDLAFLCKHLFDCNRTTMPESTDSSSLSDMRQEDE